MGERQRQSSRRKVRQRSENGSVRFRLRLTKYAKLYQTNTSPGHIRPIIRIADSAPRTCSFQPEEHAMKSALTLVLALAASAFAQNNASPVQSQGACGPLDAKFDAQAGPGQSGAQLQPGKAMIYVAEDSPKAPGELGHATLRVGQDGAWVGATRANSYLSFTVDPGEHHLCTR